MVESEARIARRIGAAVRRGRKARGWSQTALAEQLDLSVDYVGMLERGERLPSLSILIRIAQNFGETVASLLGAPSTDAWVEEALALLRAVPESARDATMAMLRGVAASTGEPETVQRPRSRRKP